MNWLRSRQGLAVLLFLVGLFVVLPIPGSRGLKDQLIESLEPIIKTSSSLGNKGRLFFRKLFELGRLSESYSDLTFQVAKLEAEKAELGDLKAENDNLKKTLKLKERSKAELVFAEVLGREPLALAGDLIIDRGNDQGLIAGQPVFAASEKKENLAVLIGFINQSDSKTSSVSLISNKQNVLQVKILETNETGVLKGGLSGLIVDNLPASSQAQPSQTIVTSGLSDRLPAGLYVGQVEAVLSKESDIFKRVSVKAPINYSELRYLVVEVGQNSS